MATNDGSDELNKYFYGVNDSDKAKLNDSKSAIKANIGNPSTGVQTNISNSTLTATNAVKISGVEKNDGNLKNGAISGALHQHGVGRILFQRQSRASLTRFFLSHIIAARGDIYAIHADNLQYGASVR